MYVDLYPHQVKAVNELRNGNILCGGVGTGKSLTALAYYLNNETHEDLYVITTAKKRDALDWEKEAAAFGIGKESNATVAGTLKVDSWNNIAKYKDIANAFFIFDEQRVVGSGAWVKSFLKITKKNQWILLSATPGDTWLDYIPVFVANGFYKNQTEFRRSHVIYNTYAKFPKVDRYVGVSQLVRHRNAILVEMPYVRHTTRVMNDVIVDYDKDLFERCVKQRWDPYEEAPMKDVGNLFRVMRRIVNSDSSRVEAVKNLMLSHNRLIVFYNFDYELEALRKLSTGVPDISELKSNPGNEELLKTTTRTKLSDKLQQSETPITELNSTIFSIDQKAGNTTAQSSNDQPKQSPKSVSIAEWNGHKHEPIPDTEKWVYLVQYQAGAEGWNCIETDAMVFFSLTYSYRNFHQSQGRIDRLNSPFLKLNYYVLKSEASIDREIWRALSNKQDFHESGLKKVF